MSTMNWKDPETKSKLYLAILASSEDALKGAKADSIAAYLGCTAKAVSHQMTALRKEIEAFKNGGTLPPSTPGSGKKRKDKDANGDEEESPTKKAKAKATPKKGGRKAKMESDEEMKVEDKEESDDVASRKNAAEGKEAASEEESG